MQLFRKSLVLTALFALLLVAPATSAAAPASVKVKTCKSSAWYSGREVGFRTKIRWQNLAVAQNLRVKLEVFRKLNESAGYSKLKLPKLNQWRSPESKASSVYVTDWMIENVETSAQYRARVNFRWSDPVTGAEQFKKTVWSKPCRQKTGLPKLSLTSVSSEPVPGTGDVRHTIDVTNSGRSEALKIPLELTVDGWPPVKTTLDSLARGETKQVQLIARSCTNSAMAAFNRRSKLFALRPTIYSMNALRVPDCR